MAEYNNSKEYTPKEPDSNFKDQNLYYSTLEVLGENEQHTMYMTADEVNLVNEHYIIDFPYNCIQFYRKNYDKTNNFKEGLVEIVPKPNPDTVASNLNISTTIQQVRKVYEMADYIMISQPIDLIGWYNITKDSLKELLRIIKNQYGLYDLPENTGSYKFDRRAKKWLKTNELEEKITNNLQGTIYIDGSPVNIEKKLSFLERIKLWFQNFWTKLKTTIITWGEGVRDFFEDGIRVIKNWGDAQHTNWQTFWEAIKNYSASSDAEKKEALEKIKQAFKNIIVNMFNSNNNVVSFNNSDTTFESTIDLEKEVTSAIAKVNMEGFYSVTDNIITDINVEQLIKNNILTTETGSVVDKTVFTYNIKTVVPHTSLGQTYAIVAGEDDSLASNECRYFYLAVAKGKKIKIQTQNELIQFNDWEVPIIAIDNDILNAVNTTNFITKTINEIRKTYDIKQGIGINYVLVMNSNKEIKYVLTKTNELINTSANGEENKFYCSWIINNELQANNATNNKNSNIFIYSIQEIFSTTADDMSTITTDFNDISTIIYKQTTTNNDEPVIKYWLKEKGQDNWTDVTETIQSLTTYTLPNYNFDRVVNVKQDMILNPLITVNNGIFELSDIKNFLYTYNDTSLENNDKEYYLSLWNTITYEQDYAQNGLVYLRIQNGTDSSSNPIYLQNPNA